MQTFIQAFIQASLPSGFFDMIGMARPRNCLCQPPAELALLLTWCDFAHRIFRAELSSASSLIHRPRFALRIVSIRKVSWTMTRPRGRPQRGSAWKPRRPFISPSDSPSITSSSQRHPGQPSAHSRSRFNVQSTSRALAPSLSSPPQRHARSPSDSTSDPDSHSQHASRGAGPLPRGYFTNIQLWDSMTTLYDLVFEIRQEVDDLYFHLQDTGAKVDTFLRTLSSLKSALTPSSDEDDPMEMSVEEKDDEAEMGSDVAPQAAPGAVTDANRDGANEAMDEAGQERNRAAPPGV